MVVVLVVVVVAVVFVRTSRGMSHVDKSRARKMTLNSRPAGRARKMRKMHRKNLQSA